jgi:hypothetical protein
VRISKLTSIILLSSFLLIASACSSAPGQTPPATRAATQTPWIIYVNVTSTPEPATVTPLPTVSVASPTRTATKAVARPTSTKAPPTVAAVAAAPSATVAPACSLGTITPTFPEDGAPRNTRADGSGGSAVVFKWQPPNALASQTDPHVGYMVQVESHRGNSHVNGTTLFVSANKFLQDGQLILDPRAVSSLAAGDDAVATWNVTTVKSSGSFSDTDPTVRPPDLINCGSPSQNMSIRLLVNQ